MWQWCHCLFQNNIRAPLPPPHPPTHTHTTSIQTKLNGGYMRNFLEAKAGALLTQHPKITRCLMDSSPLVDLFFRQITHFSISASFRTFCRSQRSCWKVMFLHLSVSHSVHRGDGGSASVYAGIADPPHPQEQIPQEQTAPREQTPPPPPGADTPHRRRHPREQIPPRSRHPPPSACWEIRPTSGRYVSYWNAFLL